MLCVQVSRDIKQSKVDTCVFFACEDSIVSATHGDEVDRANRYARVHAETPLRHLDKYTHTHTKRAYQTTTNRLHDSVTAHEII